MEKKANTELPVVDKTVKTEPQKSETGAVKSPKKGFTKTSARKEPTVSSKLKSEAVTT